ncbi:MAG TPA: TRAP transporter substrate-binding protein [Bacillota bacterium]
MKRTIGILLTGVIILVLVAGLTFTGHAAPKKVVWKMSHTGAPDAPYHQAALTLAKLVNEKSKGNFEIQVYHSSVLGWEREVLEGMQLGTIAATWASTGPLATFVPSYDVFNLPFLFRDEEHMMKALKSPAMQKLYKDAENYGFIVPGVGGPVFRIPMNSKRPINVPDDFKGIKFRTMAVPAHIDAYKAFGANVTTTSFSELYSALQLGAVDGCENTNSSLHLQNFYEVCGYVSELPMINSTVALVYSKVLYDKLPKEYKKILDEASVEALKRVDEEFIKQEVTSKEFMLKQGIKFNRPDPEPFIKATEPVREKYLKAMKPWVRELVEEIQNIQ